MVRNPLNLIVFVAIVNSAFLPTSMNAAQELPGSEAGVFVTVVYPETWSETNTILLVESIRSFAGSLSGFPIWCFVPQYGKEISAVTAERLTNLKATLIPYDIDIETARFFFAADIQAAARAESMAVDQAQFLIWLSSNTIILKEPKDFLLSDDKVLGYRPVHHTNVGSPYETPLDTFWALVYKYCAVPGDRVFPMETHVDAKTIRPYFNAGILITRPGKHLLQNWRDTFFAVWQTPELQELYQKDERYTIFAHQAILSGVILNMFSQHEMQELPNEYNYPIHLLEEDVSGHRPSKIEDLVTIRHEGFYMDPDWMEKMPAGETLKQWLADKLPK